MLGSKLGALAGTKSAVKMMALLELTILLNVTASKLLQCCSNKQSTLDQDKHRKKLSD
jgi:hypothetical protein